MLRGETSFCILYFTVEGFRFVIRLLRTIAGINALSDDAQIPE